MKGESLSLTLNAICISVISFAPLLAGLSACQLQEMDQKLQKQIHTAAGLSITDAKEILFILRKGHGLGIRCVTMTHLINVARECEVLMNDCTEAARVIRSRTAAALGLEHPPVTTLKGNFMTANT